MLKQVTALGITAPKAILPPTQFNPLLQMVGCIVKIAGSEGSLVFNDCASLEEVSAENVIERIPLDMIGRESTLNFPVHFGLVVFEVPRGMVLDVAYAYFVVGRRG